MDIGIEIETANVDESSEHELEIYDAYDSLENFEQVAALEGNFTVKYLWFRSGYPKRDIFFQYKGESFSGTWIPKMAEQVIEYVEYSWGKVGDFTGEIDSILNNAHHHADCESRSISWDDQRLQSVILGDLINEYYQGEEEDLFIWLKDFFVDHGEDFSIYPQQFRAEMERIYRKYKDQESQDS